MADQAQIAQPQVNLGPAPESVALTSRLAVTRLMVPPNVRMERSFRIPVVATIVFVITMMAIYFLGRTVAGFYTPTVQDGKIEFVGRL
jgi:hypothetical protein